jgi:hypothetical protein
MDPQIENPQIAKEIGSAICELTHLQVALENF